MFANWLDAEFLPLCSNLQASDGVSLLARKSVPVHLLGWSWVEPLLASAERKQKRSRAVSAGRNWSVDRYVCCRASVAN